MEEHSRRGNRLILEEMDYDRTQLEIEFNNNHQQLNEEQLRVFGSITNAVEMKSGGFFFIYGSGGTGKTFLWRTIIASLRSQGKIVLAVASSGIASLLLPGGRTVHSRFNIPLNIDEYSTCNVKQRTDLAKLIQKADLVIWDEAPMNHKNVFEAVDRTFRDIIRSEVKNSEDKVFGGKTVVLGGDFRQILPVVERGSREDIVSSSISKSYLWEHCRLFILKENMRLRNNNLDKECIASLREFGSWILNLGEGKLSVIKAYEGEEPSLIKTPDDLLIHQTDNPIKDIVSTMYLDIKKNFTDKDYLKNRCILAPTNNCIDEVNSHILSRIPGETHQFLSADSCNPVSEQSQNQDMLDTMETLNTIQISGMPNHVIELKVGVPIMLLRNTNPTEGMCNGTRLIITQMKSTVLEGEIITGTHVGAKRTIPRIVMISLKTDWDFILRRTQFPIKVCFAMTINKSQGQTLRNVGLYLPTPVFTHGQLYVTASRTTSRQGLKILIKRQENELDGYTKNVVYQEILTDLIQDDDLE